MVTEIMWSDGMRRGGHDGIGWSELKAPVFVLFSFLVIVGILIGVNI